MPQSLSKVSIHFVFSTKSRTPWLKDSDLRKELYAYMAALFRDKLDSPAIIINGVEDHVHALVLMSRSFAIKDLMEVVKKETSKWVKRQSDDLHDFSWQAGYASFSVSESNISQVKRYIQNQEEHHKTMSFKDEFREICKRHQIEIDERYVWD